MAILFSDNTYRADKIFDLLKAAMPEIELRKYPNTGNAAEIDYAIIWRPAEGSLTNLPNLKAIFAVSAGVDGIIYDRTLPDVPIVRSVDADLTQGMVEYVTHQVLHYHRHFHLYENDQPNKLWKQRPQTRPQDRIVGIMGMGEMGRACAEILRILKFNVRGWSRTVKKIPGVTSFAGKDELNNFLNGVDILVNVLPLTPETSGILNARVFAQLPRGSFIINAGRGQHLVEADLIRAMDNGILGGATLDVFHTEPLPPESPLWRHAGITLTPHIASITNFTAVARNIINHIKCFEAGKPLPHQVNKALGY